MTPKADRAAFIDVVRGYALFGLFIVHMIEYFELYWADVQPHWVHDLIFGVFGGKAYALLALCFGFSFQIMFERARGRGEPFAGLFVRRLAILAIFGFLHSLVYRGDIILVLVLCGLLLIPIDRLRNNAALVGIAILCFAQPFLLARILAAPGGAEWANAMPLYFTDLVFDRYKYGSALDVLVANVIDGRIGNWSFYIETGRIFQIYGMFMLGALIQRTGLATRVTAQQAGIGAAVTAGLLLLAMAVRDNAAATLDPAAAVTRWTGMLLSQWVELSAALLSLCLLALVWRLARPLIGHFATPGRMTLTFYIGQSVLLVPFFYGFGAGAYAWIGQTGALVLGLLLWVVQWAFARWWLAGHAYGPLERLWRQWTFGSRQLTR